MFIDTRSGHTCIRNRESRRLPNWTAQNSSIRGRLPSQAGVKLFNSLTRVIIVSGTLKLLKTRLKQFLCSKAIYSVNKFLQFDWADWGAAQ